MTKRELEGMLDRNPNAKKHEELIRKGIESVEELRKQGIEQRRYGLASRFGHRDITRPESMRRRKVVRMNFR